MAACSSRVSDFQKILCTGFSQVCTQVRQCCPLGFIDFPLSSSAFSVNPSTSIVCSSTFTASRRVFPCILLINLLYHLIVIHEGFYLEHFSLRYFGCPSKWGLIRSIFAEPLISNWQSFLLDVSLWQVPNFLKIGLSWPTSATFIKSRLCFSYHFTEVFQLDNCRWRRWKTCSFCCPLILVLVVFSKLFNVL